MKEKKEERDHIRCVLEGSFDKLSVVFLCKILEGYSILHEKRYYRV